MPTGVLKPEAKSGFGSVGSELEDGSAAEVGFVKIAGSGMRIDREECCSQCKRDEDETGDNIFSRLLGHWDNSLGRNGAGKLFTELTALPKPRGMPLRARGTLLKPNEYLKTSLVACSDFVFRWRRPPSTRIREDEAGAGIEPANRGFADPDLTTWLPRRLREPESRSARTLCQRSGAFRSSTLDVRRWTLDVPPSYV